MALLKNIMIKPELGRDWVHSFSSDIRLDGEQRWSWVDNTRHVRLLLRPRVSTQVAQHQSLIHTICSAPITICSPSLIPHIEWRDFPRRLQPSDKHCCPCGRAPRRLNSAVTLQRSFWIDRIFLRGWLICITGFFVADADGSAASRAEAPLVQAKSPSTGERS